MALALCLVWLCLSYSTSNAQVDSTTGNLINFTGTPTATTGNWNNVGQFGGSLTCWAAGNPGYCGPLPRVNANGYGMINFSYGQTDLNQIVNINAALAAGGSGVQLSGFNFGFRAKNGNGWDNGQQDYLDAYVKFYNASGGLAATYDYGQYTNNKYNWTQFNFTETFANPSAATNFSNAQVGFIGRDTNYWVGPYGPEVTNVSFSLKYRVDPCSLNPAYAPTCAGFNNIVTSGNLLNPNLMSNGNIVYNSFAINTALKSSGAGVDVYGFNYGYNYSLGDPTTTGNSTAEVRVRLTDINNNVVYTDGQFRNTPQTAENVSYQFLLPSTTNSLSLGTFTMGASTTGNAAVQNMFANALYKPDPCVDPLYSPTCPGYATAYAKNLILGSTVAAASAPVGPPAPAPAPPASGAPSPAAAPDPTNPAPQQQAQQAPAPGPQQGPQPQQQDPNQNPSAVAANPAQPNPTQPGPQVAGAPQPAGGPQQTPAQQTASNPPQAGPQPIGKTAIGPSATAMSAVKSAQEKDKATQQMAVQNAAKVVEASTQQSQATATAAVAMLNDMSTNSASAAAQFSSQTTQASFQTIQTGQTQQAQQNNSQQTQQQTTKIVQQAYQEQQTQQTQLQSYTGLPQLTQSTAMVQQQQDTSSTTVAMLKPSTPASVEISPQASSGNGFTVSRNPFAYNPLTPTTGMFMTQPAPTAFQFRNETKTTEVETPQIQTASFGGAGRAGNPLSEMMMQQRLELFQNTVEQRTDAVNKNAQQNELAGGVKLEAMALQPRGFEAYSVTLKDASFYEPKEIYRNQTTIDNVRALRQMASDRVYQEMLDMQYKIGE